MHISKDELRRILLRKRNVLTQQEIESHSLHITEAILSLEYVAMATIVHCYMSFSSEVMTSHLVHSLLSMEKKVYVPVVDGAVLRHALIDSTTAWEHDRYGIPTPIAETISTDELIFDKNDCIIIPMVGFDSNRTRLGYGKGYYDRFLAGKHGVNIGLAFSCQQYDAIPADTHDVPMHVIMTETHIFHE